MWIKESIGLQRQLVASVIATNGPITPLEFNAVLDYGDDVFAAVERVATEPLAKAITIAGKAERNAATDAVKDAAVAELAGTSDAPGEFAGREKEIKEAVRSLTKKLVRTPDRRTRACASTAVASPTCVRCRPRSACCRRRTARACSSAARPRCSTCARWPCRA